MELFDLLDDLEALLNKGKKPIFGDANFVRINKKEMLDLVEIIRRMLDEKYQALKNKITDEASMAKPEPYKYKSEKVKEQFENDLEASEIIKRAQKEALEIKNEIDDYSDKVLENLKLTVTKFKGKLLKMDTILDLSRERLKKTTYFNIQEEGTDNE